MTKEELEKEAVRYCTSNCGDCYGCHKKYRKNKNCERLKSMIKTYLVSAEPREKRIAELEAQIEKMKSQYDYAFNQLCESREIVCLMLSQYKNKKEIDYSTKERGEKLLKQGVYKYD